MPDPIWRFTASRRSRDIPKAPPHEGGPEQCVGYNHLPGEWLDKEVTALTTKRVRQVTVTHPNGDTLHLSKANPEDLDFRMDSIPAGFKVSSQFNVNNVVGTLVQLSLEDVKPQAEIDFVAKPGVLAVMETFDGLRLRVHTTKQLIEHFQKHEWPIKDQIIIR